MGSQSTSLNYKNICFDETEEKLPDGWKPVHVQPDSSPMTAL